MRIVYGITYESDPHEPRGVHVLTTSKREAERKRDELLAKGDDHLDVAQFILWEKGETIESCDYYYVWLYLRPGGSATLSVSFDPHFKPSKPGKKSGKKVAQIDKLHSGGVKVEGWDREACVAAAYEALGLER